MRIIIDHKETRREIDGSFVIQGEVHDLHVLACAIFREIDKHRMIDRLWVEVSEPGQQRPVIHLDRPPQPWD